MKAAAERAGITKRVYQHLLRNLLRNGSKLNFIAKWYKVAVPTLINWIEKNNIDRTPQP